MLLAIVIIPGMHQDPFFIVFGKRSMHIVMHIHKVGLQPPIRKINGIMIFQIAVFQDMLVFSASPIRIIQLADPVQPTVLIFEFGGNLSIRKPGLDFTGLGMDRRFRQQLAILIQPGIADRFAILKSDLEG